MIKTNAINAIKLEIFEIVFTLKESRSKKNDVQNPNIKIHPPKAITDGQPTK